MSRRLLIRGYLKSFETLDGDAKRSAVRELLLGSAIAKILQRSTYERHDDEPEVVHASLILKKVYPGIGGCARLVGGSETSYLNLAEMTPAMLSQLRENVHLKSIRSCLIHRPT